jgi:hypothetical protein
LVSRKTRPCESPRQWAEPSRREVPKVSKVNPSTCSGTTSKVPKIKKALSQTEWVNNIPSPLTGEG